MLKRCRSSRWDVAKKQLVGDYFELLRDEHEEVRITAFENFHKVADMMDADCKKLVLWPFWKQTIAEAYSIEDIVFREYGRCFWNLKGTSKPLHHVGA